VKWLAETHGTKFELVRHFLARMLDGEWSSTPGQWQSVVVGAFALLLPAGVLLVREGSLKPGYGGTYRELSMLASPEPFRAAALADELALLTLVFAVTGLIALIQWQSLFPGRRDYLALAGLPIRSRQIFAARFGAVLVFSTALVVAMNLLPSLVAPIEFGGRWQKNPSFLVNVGAQAAASGLGCFFVLFAIVSIQGVLLNTLSGRLFARVSVYVQGALIGLMLLAGLYSWRIRDWRQETIAQLPQFSSWAPPVWFAGLHERLLGDPDPFFHAMANRALLTALAAAVMAVVTYLVSYRRYRTLMVESPDHVEAPRKRRWSALRLVSSGPQQEAVMQFMAATLARSRAHRVIWLAYIGAAVGILVNSLLISGELLRRSAEWNKALKFAVLFWPLGTSVVLLPGIRHVFSIPAELSANWIFRITEGQGRKEWMRAVERFVMLYAVAPVYVLLFPVAVHVLGWPLAIRMTLLQVMVSLTLFELLFYSWQQLPFTCSYVPGKRPLIAIVAAYTAALGVAVPLLSLIVRAGSEFPELFPAFFAFFCGLWLWARHNRREGWGEAKLLYEDLPAGVPDLGIKDMGWGSSCRLHAASCQPTQANRPSNRPVAASLRVYCTLARAFPYEFRNAYEEELVQVTEDAIEPIWRRHGALGLARLLLDIAVRVPAEHLAELWQDIRYGLRMLAASPGFTAVALISLSLGICIGTSAFSFMNATILRNVPGVQKPDELVAARAPVPYPSYKRYRERSGLFSSTLAYAPVPFGVSVGGRTERTWGHLVTPSYFSTLGAHPALGRVFDAEEEHSGRAPVAVVSYRFWQDRLGSDTSIVGKTLRINGYPCEIIGVGPKEFLGASPMIFAADLWMPVSVDSRVTPELADKALERRRPAMFRMIGRLNKGVTVARAESELDTVERQLEQDYGDADRDQKGRRLTLVTGGRLFPIRPENLLMLTASPIVLVGLMLLIACSNVANMMLARAAARRREIAVRLALGASRARLIRQLLTESMLVASGAAVMGFLLTAWLMRLLSQTDTLRISAGTPYPMLVSGDLGPDSRVLLFTLGLALFTGLAFGLAPAIQATRTDLTPALKGDTVWLRKYGRLSLRNILVVSQVAGSLALLLLTGVLALGYQRAMGMEVGFNPSNLYLISLDPVRDGYSGEQATAFFRTLLEQIKRLPSVTAASLTESSPMWARPAFVTLSAAGADARSAPVIGSAEKYVVGKDYFDTSGVPILLGRGFRREDKANGAISVIVSERLARDFWNGDNPLGRRIEVGRQVYQVVGVSKRAKVSFALGQPPPAIYYPLRPENYSRASAAGITLMVRAAPGADALDAVRREISAIDVNLTAFNAFSMTEQIDRLLFVSRIGVWIHGFEGLFGLILASIGLAGMTAYSVAQRGREIGIRIALGAQSADVLGLMMKEGAVLVTVGAILGLAGAWAGTRLLSGLISAVGSVTGTSAFEPALLVGAPLLLACLALVACYVPARRSLRIDPVVALRQE
jgi:predicted permease